MSCERYSTSVPSGRLEQPNVARQLFASDEKLPCGDLEIAVPIQRPPALVRVVRRERPADRPHIRIEPLRPDATIPISLGCKENHLVVGREPGRIRFAVRGRKTFGRRKQSGPIGSEEYFRRFLLDRI